MKKGIIFILIFLLVNVACNKYNVEKIELAPWEADIALPLINSTFSVSDVFEIDDNSVLEYINVDEGLLGITYSGSIFSYDASEIIEVSDQTFTNTISYPDPGLPISFTDTLYSSLVFTLDFESQNLEGIEAKYLKMLTGNLQLVANSEVAYSSNIKLTIPHMKKNGISYQFESAIQPGESVSDTESLASYNLDLSQENMTYNQLRLDYQLIIEYNPNTPSTGEDVTISLQFVEPVLDYVVGYFGNNSLADQIDTIKIELFNNTISGHFQFLDPYMEVNFTNSFGFPTMIDITEFKSVNQQSGEVTPLYLEGLTDDPFEISHPSQIGDSTLDQYFFDNSNSNIEVILNDADKYVVWGLDASSNPNGPGSTFNFLSHTSKMVASTSITVPLKGYAWDWVFSDTTLLENGIEIEDPEELSNLTLRLILNNGFPAEGYVQIYTLDSTNLVTDSLFDSPTMILESGILSNGIVIESTKTITDIALTENKKEHFINARKLVTSAKMQTTNGSEMEPVQIYDYYSIDVMMGVRANVLIAP